MQHGDVRLGFACTHIIAFRTSLIGITPSFSPSNGWENITNASLISFSSCAVMPCSLASFDCRALGAASSAGGGARRFAGWE